MPKAAKDDGTTKRMAQSPVIANNLFIFQPDERLQTSPSPYRTLQGGVLLQVRESLLFEGGFV